MGRNKLISIVIDTNLWISFIISNKFNQLDLLLYKGKIRLLFSEELLIELEDTISKPKLRKYFNSSALYEMLFYFEPYIDFIDVSSKAKGCRDPKDNFLLSLAKDGKAEYLLKGDKDLLELCVYGKTKIKTMAEFLSVIKGSVI
jgi:putative PIN family toxin of toxin-antitoxin system